MLNVTFSFHYFDVYVKWLLHVSFCQIEVEILSLGLSLVNIWYVGIKLINVGGQVGK